MFRIPRTFPALLLAAGLTACGGGLSGADLATAQTITFDAAPTLTLGGTAQVSASASSGLAVSFSSLSSTVCSVSSTGRVTAWPSATAWWPPTRPVTPPTARPPRSPRPWRCRWTRRWPRRWASTRQLGHHLRVGRSASVSATASSGLAVAYRSLTPACAAWGQRWPVQGLAVGDCVIAADQAGDDRYAAATEASWGIAVLAADALTVPGQPVGVSATLGANAQSVVVSAGSVDDGGSAITGYTIASVPAGITATVSSLPATVACGGSCAGHAFTVSARNAQARAPRPAPRTSWATTAWC
jgi:hypothetical protein